MEEHIGTNSAQMKKRTTFIDFKLDLGNQHTQTPYVTKRDPVS